ncbi:MAG TPA: diacylglycerol kinase family protein [Spirochaetia bacterium]|nr:diacylglycerol kinase family protein [Spirochaetia bacterium]
MRILLVYNPNAAHGRAGTALPLVREAFQQEKVDIDERLTGGPEDAMHITAEAPLERYQGVVAAGGDGTLFETVNGYYRNPSTTRPPLGVLPVGTGNAFARDLDLDAARWREAVAVIAAGKTRRVDVGRYRSQGEVMYYLNILGLGFVADVTLAASRLKLLGNVSYTIGVILRTVFLRPFRVHLEADGRVVDTESIFAEISNTRYTSNFLMAPAASIDDGLLDVTLLSRLNRRRLLSCFPLIFTGEHVRLPEVITFKARKILITTETPKVLTPDGELLGKTPVSIECLARDIAVFCR